MRFSSADGVLFEKGETKMLFQYPAGKRNSDYVVPSDVSCIGDYAFYDATYLRVAILPADLIEIRPYAFYFCVSLSEIKIPAATAIIG